MHLGLGDTSHTAADHAEGSNGPRPLHDRARRDDLPRLDGSAARPRGRRLVAQRDLGQERARARADRPLAPELWRSTRRVAHSSSVDTIVVGRNEIAFSTSWRRSRLYLAPLGGREHFVAGGQFPLGWTNGGLYVGRRDGAVLFRSGNRVRRIAQAKVRLAAYDPSSQSLDFVSGCRLFRARGIRTQLVASLSRFGLPSERNLQLQLLGHLIALQNQRRLVVLRPDGSLFASTLLPRSHHALVSASPTAAPGGTEVAFAVMRPDRPIETQVMERGVETVYLLRPGARAADPVHKKRMWFNVCGHGASLSWRRTWLLYSTGEGPAAAIATRSGRTIELTALIRRLPGFKGDDSGPFSVTWR